MTDTNFDVDIRIDKSPVPAALDKLYDFVSGFAVGDKVALLGNIIDYEIVDNAPLYNDYIVRAFADRTIQTSPMPYLAPGDFAERFSERYKEILHLLVMNLQSELPAVDQEKIQRHEATIRAVSHDRNSWLTDFEIAWSEEAARLGIDVSKVDSDPEVAKRYFERRIVYMRHRRFSQTLRRLNDEIESSENQIEAIQYAAFPDDEARQLISLHKKASKYETIRPRQSELEIKYGWDAFTIQNEEYRDMNDIFDIGPMLESIVDPRVINRSTGARDYSVTATDTVTESHDRAWSARGSAAYLPFFAASMRGKGESHFKATFKNMRSITIGFQHLGQLDLTRGGWYTSTIFEFGRVKEILRRNETLAQKLKFITTGLIIGRGLSLELEFTDLSDVREWGSVKRRGSGGINIGGFMLGGGGSSSRAWDTRKISEDKRTVTFNDDPGLCRLLGVVLAENDIDLSDEEVALGARPLYTIPRLADAAMQDLSASRKNNS